MEVHYRDLTYGKSTVHVAPGGERSDCLDAAGDSGPAWLGAREQGWVCHCPLGVWLPWGSG